MIIRYAPTNKNNKKDQPCITAINFIIGHTITTTTHVVDIVETTTMTTGMTILMKVGTTIATTIGIKNLGSFPNRCDDVHHA